MERIQEIAMILGIGTDLLNLQRIRAIRCLDKDPFIVKSFTEKERAQAFMRPVPADYFATRFAGKEAVFTCLGVDGNALLPKEVEILGTETGAPQVTLLGNGEAIARQKGIRSIQISLSYDTDYAIAFAVAQD